MGLSRVEFYQRLHAIEEARMAKANDDTAHMFVKVARRDERGKEYSA